MQTTGALLIPPALILCCTRDLIRPFSSPLHVARQEFQTSVVFWDIDTAAKFIGTWAATVGVAGSGAGIGDSQQLFSYAILNFALSEAFGLFCLMVAFLILFTM
ncbi:unnamed protein product [Nyctereutes procyonoides]|uniref:(raccoon dog) hypothetical protein n=1 Tax=Nyctereutes procyonoides TaxID=34880 RepID=A0A811ZV00_NYCPR|nr:unnamed protein product [Nyctereutes procyonoides]